MKLKKQNKQDIFVAFLLTASAFFFFYLFEELLNLSNWHPVWMFIFWFISSISSLKTVKFALGYKWR